MGRPFPRPAVLPAAEPNQEQKQPPGRNQNGTVVLKQASFETERPSSLPLVIGGVAKEMGPASGLKQKDSFFLQMWSEYLPAPGSVLGTGGQQ